MTLKYLREKLEYHFTVTDILDELERWFGDWNMEDAYRDILNKWGILDEDEDEDGEDEDEDEDGEDED